MFDTNLLGETGGTRWQHGQKKRKKEENLL